jgi:hypothetical protein
MPSWIFPDRLSFHKALSKIVFSVSGDLPSPDLLLSSFLDISGDRKLHYIFVGTPGEIEVLPSSRSHFSFRRVSHPDLLDFVCLNSLQVFLSPQIFPSRFGQLCVFQLFSFVAVIDKSTMPSSTPPDRPISAPGPRSKFIIPLVLTVVSFDFVLFAELTALFSLAGACSGTSTRSTNSRNFRRYNL